MARWNFKNHHVQQFDNTETASQVGSKAVLISVGPPTWEQAAGGQAVVMGMVQQFSMQQQRQVAEIFEIGSERRYYLDNPHRAQLTISRVLISGPSLLKILGTGLLNRGMGEGEIELERLFQDGGINAAGADPNNNLWINIASDLFNNPLGIMLEFEEFHGDGTSSNYGTVYLQNCKLQGHSMAMQSQMWMIQEDINMLFEYAIPIVPAQTVQGAYEKRKEIMETISVNAPKWYTDNFAKWTGEAPKPVNG